MQVQHGGKWGGIVGAELLVQLRRSHTAVQIQDKMRSTFYEADIHMWRYVSSLQNSTRTRTEKWESSCIIHPDVLATRQDLGFRNRESMAQISIRQILSRTQAKQSVHEKEVWAVNSVLKSLIPFPLRAFKTRVQKLNWLRLWIGSSLRPLRGGDLFALNFPPRHI